MSKTGSFRSRQRPSSVGSSSREETRSPSGSARPPTAVSTIGGIGRPTGVTSSQFSELRKVFEAKCSDDKEKVSGEDTGLASPRREYSQENSPALSPLPSSGLSSNRGLMNTGGNNNSGSSRLMSDETGQKEESQSSQSQSDEGDEYISRLPNNTPNQSSPISQGEELHVTEMAPLRFSSHTCILDGRPVHKELDQSSSTIANSGKHSWADWGEEQRSSLSTPTFSSDSDLLTRIDSLLKEKNRLDSQLQEMTEKNQSLQRELTIQRKSFAKTQDRSNDTVELLKSENSHLTKSLSLVEKERDQLALETKELQTQFEENLEKLVQMEKLYHEAETHGQEIEEELSSVLKKREKLKEQKNKLDSDILEARKTKESLRLTIHKLRDQNTSLEEKLGAVTREKSILVKEKSAKESTEQDLLSKLETTEKTLVEIETENERITDKLKELEKEKESLKEQLAVSNSSLTSWRKQYDEIKREKEAINKKLISLSQHKIALQEKEVWLLNEIDTSVNNVFACYPSLKIPPSLQVKEKGKGHELPQQLERMMALHNAVLSKLTSLTEEKDSLTQSVLSLNGQLKEKESAFIENEKLCTKLRTDLETCHSDLESRYSKLNIEYCDCIAAFEKERERTKDEMTELIQANETLEEDIEEVSNSYHALLEEKQIAKKSLQDYKFSSQEIIAHLLVEKVCLSSLLVLNAEKLSDLSSNDTLSQQVELLTSERGSLKQSLDEANNKLREAQVSLERAREERANSVLETDKLKVQLMTEISLLKSQVSNLEKDKTVLEMQISSSTGSNTTSTSAFQPVFGAGGSGRKTQQEMIELQQKVTLLENENKRLNDIIHSSPSSLDTGNALRRQILEMRKKIYFLEAEKKQMTEKVSNLHSSLKMMRESKDRLTQDRLKTLQEENTSLQDRIRNMEDIFTRKLMCSDATISSTAKENDTLRLKLNIIPDSIKIIKSFNGIIAELAAAVQEQEDDLVSLRTSLSGAGISLSPAGDILERVLKTHADMQELLTNRSLQDEGSVTVSKSSSSLGRSSGGLPPVLQQLSPEYISSLQGNNTAAGVTSNTGPITRLRSQSHSQALNPLPSATLVYQIREKLSQIYADNLSISDLIKHVQETLGTRHVEVVSLQKNLASFQSEIRITLRSLEESHENLTSLWEQELPPEQLNSILVLKHQVETWQDKVIARDMALKDIDLQMKEDYEAHNRRFSLLKGQILDLKEEMSMNADALLAKDQYIHEVEERSLNAESELYKLRKEMECILQEALNVPEGFQLQSHGGNVPELVRLQTEELHRMKGLLNEYVYQINQLQARVESMHRDNTLLQHQGIEQERHHRQVREDLHTERDYLRQQNFQLIEQQLKGEEVGDLLKKLKRSQEAMREQREIRALACELDNIKLVTREKDLRISELQHQLHSQQLETLKAHHRPLPTPTATNEGLMPSTHKTYPHVNVSGTRVFSRPHSASSAESARPSRYMITDPNHPKVINRNKLPSTLEGDFLIHLPPTTNGGGVVNLSENSDLPTGTGGYYIGYPVVTDDEGSMTVTDENSPKQPQKNRVRRHRRTASTGSDSLKNFLSSGSSASDSRPSQTNQSSTLPLSVTRQHKPPVRPGSADSMRFEMHSPVPLPPDTVTVDAVTKNTVVKEAHYIEKEPNDTISRYAKDMQEGIGKMISQHDKTERDETTPLIPIPPTKDKVSGVKLDITTPTTKPGIWNQLTGMIGKGSKQQLVGNKGSGRDKVKTVQNKTLEIPEVTMSDSGLSASHKLTEARGVLDDSVSSHLSRIPSLASSVGRSDSIASTSTTFSGVGGESSPYSTLSLDSLHIDSFENMLHLPYIRRGVAYTPLVGHHTSSSDEEGRPMGTSGRTTLKRNALVTKSSKTLPHLFQPVSIHHHGQSSCDSDQLQSDTLEYAGVPIQRSESISISDMDKDLTDNEAMQEKIHLLSKQLGRVRRSSTGSITICTHSGSSMEDIKGTD